ncbi:MAG: hypothetical protein K2H85_10600 [Allobaculum sp.]|nr:hypothetical protein [Allobaculum sp.]
MLKKLFATFLSGSLLFQGMSLPVLAEAASEPEENQNIEMYRLYNRSSGEHFYTHDLNEKDTLVGLGWKYEGIGWYAPQSSETPVYRLYNKNAGDHHYTIDKNEKDTLVKLGWNDEGISWYSDDSETIPLYRQYNPNAKAGSHNYTTSKAENDSLCSIGWKEEGIGWYALEEGEPVPAQPTPNYEELYRPILDEATRILNNQKNIQNEKYRKDLFGIVEAIISTYGGVSINDFEYVIQDFSGDGIPELAIIHTQYSQSILSLYTLVNNEPSNVFYGWARSGYNYAGGSSFAHFGSNGAAYSATGLFSISEDGKDIIWQEYYFTEPNATYFNTTGSYAIQDSKYIGGFEAYYPNSKRIQNMYQSLNSIPLSKWN